MVEFKYQAHISILPECPPLEFSSQERLAYRFVFERGEPNAKNNFLPVLIINPKRILKPDVPATQCQGYALSLFNNRDNAKKRYNQLTDKRKGLRKVLGTHLAEGTISETDGVVSNIDANGHFSLHEFTETNLEEKFEIIVSL